MTYKYKYVTAKGRTTLAVFPEKSIHPIWEATYPSYTRITGTDMLVRDQCLIEKGALKSYSDKQGLSAYLKGIGIISQTDSIK